MCARARAHTHTHTHTHTHSCILSSSSTQAQELRAYLRAKQEQTLTCQDAASNPSSTVTGNTTNQTPSTSSIEQGFLTLLEPGAPDASWGPLPGTRAPILSLNDRSPLSPALSTFRTGWNSLALRASWYQVLCLPQHPTWTHSQCTPIKIAYIYKRNIKYLYKI